MRVRRNRDTDEGGSMYAVIRRYKVERGSVDDLLRRVDEGAAPLISKIPGFVSYYVVKANDGRLASISIFDTRAGIDESTKVAASWVKENAGAFSLSTPEISAGEVVVHRGAAREAGVR
jgi:heme-degrading monooxygenase HmoA